MKQALAIIIVLILAVGMLVTTFAPLFTQTSYVAPAPAQVQVQASTAPVAPQPSQPTPGLPKPY